MFRLSGLCSRFRNAQPYRSLAFLHGNDPGVVGLCYTAWVLWYLGYPDQTLKSLQEALTLTQELSHPHSLAFALNFTASLHQLRREEEVSRERAAAVIALATEQGFPHWLARGTLLWGWTLAQGERKAEGIAQMRQGRAAWRATRTEIKGSYFLGLLAEAHDKVGQREEGLVVLDDALAVVDRTGERYYEAELYRLQEELTLQRSSVEGLGSSVQKEAEECFWQAIEIARRQSAKSLELRAVMSLSRLWQQPSKKAEAHKMLAAIYNWFTEGFDTKDLQEAKALLAQLL